MDCGPPGSSVYRVFQAKKKKKNRILQARILEWVAIVFSRDLPNPGIKSGAPEFQADSLPSEPPRKSFNPLSDI